LSISTAAGGGGRAPARAQEAVDIDPLSVEALLARAAVAEDAGDLEVAEEHMVEAVRLQPANPETWSALGDFRLNVTQDFEGAEEVLAAALYLDPRSERLKTLYTQSVRALTYEGTVAAGTD
jgi:Flp pilus assembly protein TadD